MEIHHDTLARLATYQVPVANYLDAEALKKVVADTMVGGATLTGLLGTSAWYAPGAAGAHWWNPSYGMKRNSILLCFTSMANTDKRYLHRCSGWRSAAMDGEKIIDYKLNDEEQRFQQNADAVLAT